MGAAMATRLLGAGKGLVLLRHWEHMRTRCHWPSNSKLPTLLPTHTQATG